jgi:hypothetical protein
VDSYFFGFYLTNFGEVVDFYFYFTVLLRNTVVQSQGSADGLYCKLLEPETLQLGTGTTHMVPMPSMRYIKERTCGLLHAVGEGVLAHSVRHALPAPHPLNKVRELKHRANLSLGSPYVKGTRSPDVIHIF